MSTATAAPALATTAPVSARRTGWVTHELYYWHDSGLESYVRSFQPRGSQETAESKRRFQNLVNVTPLADVLVPIKPRYATDDEILRFHTAGYLAKCKEVSGAPTGGQVGHELHISHGGFDIAALSCGGVLAAVEAVMAGKVHNAYALVRPPGHHAERDHGHGFCVFSNVSLAAAHALATLGAKRVAIVDWDVHHGNGSEQHFYASDEVLFISLHQEGLYPMDTGHAECVGEGAGTGYNLNIPLPPGSGWGAYKAAFHRVVLPALAAYKPDLILVSSGFDCSFLDPLGRMMLTSDSFRFMTRMLQQAADELCGGRLVIAHEGGYSDIYVPYCGLSCVEELSGFKTSVVDPFIADVGSAAWQALQPHQDKAIAAAEANLAIALLKPISSSAAGGDGTATAAAAGGAAVVPVAPVAGAAAGASTAAAPSGAVACAECAASAGTGSA